MLYFMKTDALVVQEYSYIMAKNYYDILGVNKSCSRTDILVAYRRLAIENHPRSSQVNDLHKFHEIAEAYEILSDPRYRDCYDKFGEFGLKEGVANENRGFVGGYRYIGNAFEILKVSFEHQIHFLHLFQIVARLEHLE